MKNSEFKSLYKSLRENQKQYYKTRKQKFLEEAKRIEKILDEEVSDQSSMF